ncbi:MAG: glutamate-1-semialdehyde 2,1-aminomutase [Leptospirales bacterium]|nr:glutamate-1-semialdehyde 2,1-aminomutase [Leptospirales bacterium]HMU83125.1 glutamate-1-semialdehyde 2,1-aminomutase [Leptospiraceae bacterium]HNE25335.1 glutamate-1-semialdehyde 2,1-aminomutase [Leptospiraceae bacterium]HNJ33688.1 glutamate-1-semialdehyde 2,1-aminomutase [Leptospiraceae bacterium]HNL70288.1 glutamate-1-semialdehyde 2,1-aminomutase [Leptospiraceae bacterium]
MNQTNSQSLYARATRVIPGGVNSPVRAFRSVGGTPIYMESATGSRLRDADGNVYVDFCNSWGPLITGHRHPAILSAIRSQMLRSLTFGTPCEQEVLLAEHVIQLLKRSVPDCRIEKIRFMSSGTEAVMTAIRLARGFTNRSKILKFDGCYHGHSDSLLAKAGSGMATLGVPDSAGVPASFTTETIVIPLDDEAALENAFVQHGRDIAAILIEPVPANNGLLLQRKEFLQKLKYMAVAGGALLIFDEVISGFRVAPGGAAQYYGICPDLVTYGKIIGGGMPVGALAGRNDVMDRLAPDGPVYQAGTLSGNPVAMSAGLAQLKLLEQPAYEHLETLGRNLETAFNAASLSWKMVRIGSIFWFYQGQEPPRRADKIGRDSMKVYAEFHRYCLERGMYLAPSGYEVGFLSTPMTEQEVSRFLGLAVDFFKSR